MWQSLVNVQHFLQKEVAKARHLVEGTIFGHLAEALKANYPMDYKRGADILCIGKDEDKWAVKIENGPARTFRFSLPLLYAGMKCGHPLSISVIAFITKMSSRGASHSISCSGNHWRNPRTDNKRSDRPQLTQVKSSFSRCLSASFCGIKSWQAFWPAGAQAGVGSWVWSTGVQAEVEEVSWPTGMQTGVEEVGWPTRMQAGVGVVCPLLTFSGI